MATSRNFRTLRTQNFGLRTLVEAVTHDRCLRKFEVMMPKTRRSWPSRPGAMPIWKGRLINSEQLYAEILQDSRRPSFAPERYAYAVSRFRMRTSPRRPIDPRWPWMAERQQLQERIIASIEAGSWQGADRWRRGDLRAGGGSSPPPASSTIESSSKRTKRGPRGTRLPTWSQSRGGNRRRQRAAWSNPVRGESSPGRAGVNRRPRWPG